MLGEVPELPAPAWVGEALPSRLGMADVARVEQLTDHLRALSRQHGVQAGIVRAAAGESMRLLAVPAPGPVTVRLGSALAHQQALAGWCCADSLLDAHAWHHFQQALELAGRAGDGWVLAGQHPSLRR